MKALLGLKYGFILMILLTGLQACRKFREFDTKPKLEPLTHGIKTATAIGYCASIAMMVFKGETLPPNINFVQSSSGEFSGAGIIHIHATNNNSIPFSKEIGDITIFGVWNNNYSGKCSGVITIIFGNFEILPLKYKFYGIYTIPIIETDNNGKILTLFAAQDIIIGSGNDTLLNLSFTQPQFNAEMLRTTQTLETDYSVVAKQNVWFVTIDQNNTKNDWHDDKIMINGGGQIVKTTSSDGGILYHAMIMTKIDFAKCVLNPVEGVSYIQNIEIGSNTEIGNFLMDFHQNCNGKAKITFATGSYIGSVGSDVGLNLN